MDSFPLFGAGAKPTEQNMEANAPQLPSLLSGTEVRSSEEIKEEGVIASPAVEKLAEQGNSWSTYFPSFGWNGFSAPQKEKRTSQTNIVKVLKEPVDESAKGVTDSSDDSALTEQCCNTTAHYINVIKENAGEIEIEALPAPVVEESSIRNDKSKKVSFGAKTKEHSVSDLNLHTQEQKKKSRSKKSKRSRKKDELKKYLKKSLKAYLKEAGPNTTPKSVESKMKKLEKSVEDMVHKAVKKEREAFVVANSDQRQAAPSATSFTQTSADSRQDPIASITMKPSEESSTLSALQEKIHSEMSVLSSFDSRHHDEKFPESQLGPSTGESKNRIHQLTQELDALKNATHSSSSTGERELPSEPEPSSDESALRASKRDTSRRWEAYMKKLRAKREGNISEAAAASQKSMSENAEQDNIAREDNGLKMKLLEKQIAEERLKISLETERSQDPSATYVDEARDESGNLSDTEKTREGNTSFQLQHQSSYPSVILASSSLVSTSTNNLSTRAKLALEEQIQAEVAELQAVQDALIYKLNMAEYSERRPTILKSDLFSKSAFDKNSMKDTETEHEELMYRTEMEKLRAKQADLFAKGRELTQF